MVLPTEKQRFTTSKPFTSIYAHRYCIWLNKHTGLPTRVEGQS